MRQTWRDLLFAHWPVAAEYLRPLLPPGLTLQTFDGRAWIGITPFLLTGLRLRALPPLPGLSRFAEINVRTYVTTEGRPGVFFFSLDAAHALAVTAARLVYRLPYARARIVVRRTPDGIAYASRRVERKAPPAEFAARYRPTGEVSVAAPGTLAHWLTERYCLYAVDRRGGLHRAEIHHPPWPLQPATVEIERNTMTAALGLTLPGAAPLVHFAERLDVHVWAPSPLLTARPARGAADAAREERTG